MSILEEQWASLAGSLSTEGLEILLAISGSICEVGVVKAGFFLLQVGPLEEIRLVFRKVVFSVGGMLQLALIGSPKKRAG